MIRVLATRPFVPPDLEYLRGRLDPRVQLLLPARHDEDTLLEAAREADALLGPFLSRRLLERHAARLKLIQVPWTGVDGLDFALLREFRPVVCNSHSNAGCVAEHAMALLLSILRAIPSHDRDLRAGLWRRPGSDRFLAPLALRGATVALLGYGAIGRSLAALLHPFGATIVALKRDATGSPPPPLRAWVGPESRLELAGRTDAIVLALPLTAATRRLVDGEFLARMKRDAVLVNVGRADLVDEEALFEALRAGRLRGAALDVWKERTDQAEPRPPSPRFPFHELDNVVLSPYRAGFAQGHLPHLDDAADNLNRLASGLPLRNRVDPDREY